jgi:hypothetical protein
MFFSEVSSGNDDCPVACAVRMLPFFVMEIVPAVYFSETLNLKSNLSSVKTT